MTRWATTRRGWFVLLAWAIAASSVVAQTVTNVGGSSLSFGSFLAGGGGTVTVAPNGFRTVSAGIIPLGQGLGVAPAQLVVHGTPYAVYAISLPADHVAALSDGSGHTLALNTFVSNPLGTGTLPLGGVQTINIGATLVVGSGQPPGSYTGSFSLSVDYQ